MAARLKQITLPTPPVRAPAQRAPEPDNGADFSVSIKIRNGRLLKAISQAGYPSVAAFSRALGMRFSLVHPYVTMKRSPFLASGKPSPGALNIADALGLNIEDIFPPQFIGKCLAKTARAEVPSLTEDQVALLIQNVPKTPEELAMFNDVSAAVDIGLRTLPPRVERVLRLRYALGDRQDEATLEEVGKDFNVSKERLRQIEAKGFRLLKHPSRSRPMLDAAAAIGIFRRYRGPKLQHVPPLAVRLEREFQKAQEAARKAQEALAKRKWQLPPAPPPPPEREKGNLGVHVLKRRVAFPDEGKTRRQPASSRIIRDRVSAPPPAPGIVIGTPGQDEWVDLRGVLFVEDTVTVAVIFHEELTFTWPGGRQAALPKGSYIVPRSTILSAPPSIVEVCEASGG
jgi:transcriptional regulator with XRE-family HTH domain